MSDYVIKIYVRDVALGDATTFAQELFDDHGEEFDAPRDFEISVSEVRSNGGTFDVDWVPR